MEIPENYRLSTADCSIEGRCHVMLVFAGKHKEEWFDLPEIYDAAGNDLRPQLYLGGVGPTIKDAIDDALKDLK